MDRPICGRSVHVIMKTKCATVLVILDELTTDDLFDATL